MRHRSTEPQQLTSNQAGFTLAELLIVIVIIGILAGLIGANLMSARVRARDAQRQSDLKAIQTAIELANSSRGRLPGGQAGATQFSSVSGPNWIPDLAPTYISQVPIDPRNEAQFFYSYVLGGQQQRGTYFLEARLESEGGTDTAAPRPPADPVAAGSFVNGTFREGSVTYFRLSPGPVTSTF